MRERPILMSGPMVRAILAGTKTQTRRPMKGAPSGDWWAPSFDGEFWRWDMDTRPAPNARLRCPYGQPGDRLWVRETWAHYQTVNHRRCPDGRSFDEVSDGLAGYRADGHNTIEDFRNHIRLMSGCDLEAVLINGDRWRPSIHMPRWACRLVLEIVSVRAERVQEISEADAMAEGFPDRAAFLDAWEAMYSKRLGASLWGWVWVVEFKRTEVPA